MVTKNYLGFIPIKNMSSGWVLIKDINEKMRILNPLFFTEASQIVENSSTLKLETKPLLTPAYGFFGKPEAYYIRALQGLKANNLYNISCSAYPIGIKDAEVETDSEDLLKELGLAIDTEQPVQVFLSKVPEGLAATDFSFLNMFSGTSLADSTEEAITSLFQSILSFFLGAKTEYAPLIEQLEGREPIAVRTLYIDDSGEEPALVDNNGTPVNPEEPLFQFKDVYIEEGYTYVVWTKSRPWLPLMFANFLLLYMSTMAERQKLPGGYAPLKVACVRLGEQFSKVEGRVWGTCPKDVTKIHISPLPESNNMSFSELEATLTQTTKANNGEYSCYLSDLFGGNYVFWCESESREPLTVQGNIVSSPNELPVVPGLPDEPEEPEVPDDPEANPCLSGDTLITMADYTTKRLDELTEGEEILSEFGPTKITHLMRGYFQPYHTLYYFEDGTVIDEISDHKFFNVERGYWAKLKTWNIGEHARRQDGMDIALLSTETVNEVAENFGIWTENHQHFANGLLGGNAAANRAVLTNITLEKGAELAATLTMAEILSLVNSLSDELEDNEIETRFIKEKYR